MLIDSHCHFNSLSEGKRGEILSSSPKGCLFIDSSTNYSSTLASLSLAKAHPFIYASLGFHPFWGKEFAGHTLEKYQMLIKENRKVVAIGEVGLDYKAEIPLDEQEKIFCAFIKLAETHNLPLVLHNRTESSRALELLNQFFSDYRKVVFHCFSYPPEFLKQVIGRGGFVSFSLNILRKKEALLSSLALCPLESMLLETDSPYMRIGKRASSPLDIKEVYSFVAGYKGVGIGELEEAIFSNAKKLFLFS